jgi:hypothetical protein
MKAIRESDLGELGTVAVWCLGINHRNLVIIVIRNHDAGYSPSDDWVGRWMAARGCWICVQGEVG